MLYCTLDAVLYCRFYVLIKIRSSDFAWFQTVVISRTTQLQLKTMLLNKQDAVMFHKVV